MCPVKTQSRVKLFKLSIWVIFGPQSLFGKTHNVSVTMTSMVAVSVNNYTHDIISFIEIFNKFITFTINNKVKSLTKCYLQFFFSVHNVSQFTHCEISGKQNTWPVFGS